MKDILSAIKHFVEGELKDRLTISNMFIITVRLLGVIINIILIASLIFISANGWADTSSYRCYELDGAKIIAEDGTFLGQVSREKVEKDADPVHGQEAL